MRTGRYECLARWSGLRLNACWKGVCLPNRFGIKRHFPKRLITLPNVLRRVRHVAWGDYGSSESYRRWHFLKHLPVTSVAVHSHNLQLFAVGGHTGDGPSLLPDRDYQAKRRNASGGSTVLLPGRRRNQLVCETARRNASRSAECFVAYTVGFLLIILLLFLLS